MDQLAADNIRALAISMVEKANSGHPGGAMGGADFMHILYTEYLDFDPTQMDWPFRDRFFMDAGHLSALMYAQYYLLGNYKKEDVQQFRQWGSVTPGHPEVDVLRGIENTSGPLGQGHAMGVGAAIAAKFLDAQIQRAFRPQNIWFHYRWRGSGRNFARSRKNCRAFGIEQLYYVL